MRIGIDASRAVRAVQTGTEIYSRKLISALLARPTSHRYRLYVDRNPGPLWLASETSDTRVIPLGRLWTHVRLGLEVARNPPDLLFVPAHVIPLICVVPSVVTIHDVGYLWFRSAYTPLAWILLHLGTIRNARGATRIVADSQSTARDLVEHFGVKRGRIQVAYLGGPEIKDISPDPTLTWRYGISDRYFLFVGTRQPRKNLARLLRAFADIRCQTAEPIELVIAGQPGQGDHSVQVLARELRIDDRVRWLGYVPDSDRANLYAGALALVFPSLYEGFGLPALEAMAWGAAVIASNTSSLPEVVGDAGILVDPLSVTALADAMAQILDDPALRERLIVRGQARAARFTWDRCAVDVERTFTSINAKE